MNIPRQGIKPDTRICALSRNWTCNLLVHGMILQPTEPHEPGQKDFPSATWTKTTFQLNSSKEFFSNMLLQWMMLSQEKHSYRCLCHHHSNGILSKQNKSSNFMKISVMPHMHKRKVGITFFGYRSSSYRLQFHSEITQSSWKHKNLNVPYTACNTFSASSATKILINLTYFCLQKCVNVCFVLVFILFVFFYQREHRTHCVKCHCKTLDSDNVLEYIQWPIFHARHAVGLVYSVVISDKRSLWQNSYLLSTQYNWRKILCFR